MEKKNLKVSRMECGNGFTFSSQKNRVNKPTNIVCQTIATPDKVKSKLEERVFKPERN